MLSHKVGPLLLSVGHATLARRSSLVINKCSLSGPTILYLCYAEMILVDAIAVIRDLRIDEHVSSMRV